MVRYYCQDTDFVFKKKNFTKRWLRFVADSELRQLGDISIIFCSDAYILDTNIKYLKHDYYTDIITFDYCTGNILSGDLFISVDSVRENSVFYNTDFPEELDRVIVHGLLHLVGYDDHSDTEISTMRGKEAFYLSARKSII
ncbi:MAG: rRNA maturation RNase YbeY [Bacteroidales bacterium]|jgi:rRNA maturation RNase YbeY|nr:rRNA maturation RNase YbeY [Bacteroidales bacterium]MCI1784860.1 rRNA maturation RNase YbeY [Bacteroidales bacterium]